MSSSKDEFKPFVWEIHPDRHGKPYLKKVYRRRNSQVDGRGSWMPVGPSTYSEIHRIVDINRRAGLLCLPDETGEFRVLVLTD